MPPTSKALEQNAERWIYEYGIMEAARELVATNKGRTTYPSREETEEARLKKEQRIIDSRTDVLIHALTRQASTFTRRSKQGNYTRSCILRETQSGRVGLVSVNYPAADPSRLDSLSKHFLHSQSRGLYDRVHHPRAFPSLLLLARLNAQYTVSPSGGVTSPEK